MRTREEEPTWGVVQDFDRELQLARPDLAKLIGRDVPPDVPLKLFKWPKWSKADHLGDQLLEITGLTVAVLRSGITGNCFVRVYGVKSVVNRLLVDMRPGVILFKDQAFVERFEFDRFEYSCNVGAFTREGHFVNDEFAPAINRCQFLVEGSYGGYCK